MANTKKPSKNPLTKQELVGLIFEVSSLIADENKRLSLPDTTVKSLRSFLTSGFKQLVSEIHFVNCVHLLHSLYEKYKPELVPDQELEKFLAELLIGPFPNFKTEALAANREWEKMLKVLKTVDDGKKFIRNANMDRERERGLFALEVKNIYSVISCFKDHPLHPVVCKDARTFNDMQERLMSRKNEFDDKHNKSKEVLAQILSLVPAKIINNVLYDSSFN